MKSREVARSQAPVAPPASNAPRQEMARDEQLDKTDNLAVHGTVGKLQTAPAPAANAVEFAKALPPPPAAATAKKSESAQANEAGALVAGVPAESKRKASVADMAARAQTVGGPLGKDSHGALIAGTITDPSGAVVPNAVVKITNAQTKDSTDVRTDSTGTYRAPVTPGVYSVEASSPGMQPVREKEITIDGMVAQNFTLHPGAAAETVEVTSEATALPAPPPPPLPQAERKAVIAAPGAGLAGGTTAELSQTYKGWLATPRWRVTPEGGLEHSVDGNSWTKPDAAPAGVLRAVAAIDSHVWAGGEGGALFHSSDGGRTWTRVRIGKKDAPLSDAITAIAIPNANSVLVSTAAGEQWSSTNGGRTWRLQSARH
ncbi:MAG: carboxypeptidase regulatory-like domain-containing protein [Terriglobales bacterium]